MALKSVIFIPILGDVYDLQPIYKTGGNNVAVTAVGICGTANLLYTDTYNF